MINCTPTPQAEPPNRKVQWSATTLSALKQKAADRSKALAALAVTTPNNKASTTSMRVQEYWEGIVFESGKLTWLQPNKQSNASQFIADHLGQKVGQAGDVRETLLNVRRLVDGNLREAGIYSMMGKQQDFAQAVKDTGVKLDAADFDRFVEEGLTPQRLAVYGNTPRQQAALLTRFNTFKADMLAKGLTDQQITDLLDKANSVASQWDEVRAVALSTGMNVGEMTNIGYIPRIFSQPAKRALERSNALGSLTEEAGQTLLAKSRETWRYLPEDEAMAAALLKVGNAQLQTLIANPSQFAEFLSKRVTDDQLDLLVDSGIMSKIPMLGTEVAEYMTRKYKIPLLDADVFIHDPVAASNGMIDKLKAGAQQSAMVKHISTEGMTAGWAIPRAVAENNPKLYSKFVKLSSVVDTAAGDLYVHPTVAANLSGLLRISASPAEMSKAAAINKWFRTNFSMQALGNPITASVYLSGQLASGMGSTVGRGAGLTDYFASLMDISLVSSKGLSAFDNVKPFRILDGAPVTHREFVAKTLRNFSHNILPGVDVTGTGAGLLDFKQLDPRYIRQHFENIRAAGQSGGVKAYAQEIGSVLKEQRDAVFLPTLRVASIIDMAGQLAVARGKSMLGYGGVKALAKDVDQAVFGWSTERFDTWEQVMGEVKKAYPMFDDVGSVTEAVTSIAPFSAWAMQNLPLQLADMLRQPNRWYNYARMTALWNDNQMGSDTLPAGGMQSWERDKYGLVLNNDPATGQTTMLFHGDLDPRWGSLTWLASLGGDKSAEGLRDKIKGESTQKVVNSLISKTMFSGVYKALSGIDPLTGTKRDDSPLEFEQFGGMTMHPAVAAVLSISPFLSSVDRLPIISGQRALLDPRTNAVIKPAVDGWLGNQGKLRPQQLENTEATLQVLGGRVRVINRFANMKMTWRDTERVMNKVRKDQSTAQQQLQIDIKRGSVSEGSDSYKKRVAAINQMTDVILQVNLDLGRIERYAEQNGLPPDKAFEQIQTEQLVLDNLPLPGADYLRQQLDEGLKAKWESK